MFDKPLKEGIIQKRNSRFTMDVMLNGEIVACHCPTTGRIGDIELKQVACLISENDNPKRKLRHTVEAISCDNLECEHKNWIGINQFLSNKLVGFFLDTHQLNEIVQDYSCIKRETKLGVSKLDFLVGNTYIEVKTALTTLEVKYGSHIRTHPVTPFSSTERFVKHINELAGSLENHERAILLTVQQYEVTNPKQRQRSTHYQEVKATIERAVKKGVESWNLTMNFTPTGVMLHTCENTTRKIYQD